MSTAVGALLFVTAVALFPVDALATPPAAEAPAPDTCFTIGDFEGYQPGDPPREWKRNKDRDLVPVDQRVLEEGSHEAVVRSEKQGGGNQFVRLTMNGYAFRLIKLSGEHFPTWNTDACPLLAWRWRVQDVPEGADETDSGNNDVAAAVYVTFGRDWLGRPESIKYTFSSTQRVGTTADYGTLKVLVVASAADGSPVGEWQSFRRDVVRDYRNLFGEAPEDATPIGVQLFSDADVRPGRRATVDFDDVRVMRR